MKHYFKHITAAVFMLIMFCVSINAQTTEKQLLPEEFDGGFKLTKPAAFYNQENLYELINGQAVFYISYGFDRLEHTFYNKGENEFTVDVYRLRDRLSAFGSYRQQKDDDADVVAVGCEGYIIDYLSAFYKDRYYIEIIPSDPDNVNNLKDMKTLAALIETKIPGTTELPPEIKMLPENGMIADSEMYTGENLLSYSFLGHGLTAEYKQNAGDKDLKVFVSFAGNDSDAVNIANEFKEKLESSETVKLTGNVGGFKGELPYRGESMVFSYKKYVFGCLGYSDEQGTLKIFNALIENLN